MIILDKLERKLGRFASPVSYTHLDVYKRQIYIRPIGGSILTITALILFLPGISERFKIFSVLLGRAKEYSQQKITAFILWAMGLNWRIVRDSSTSCSLRIKLSFVEDIRLRKCRDFTNWQTVFC